MDRLTVMVSAVTDENTVSQQGTLRGTCLLFGSPLRRESLVLVVRRTETSTVWSSDLFRTVVFLEN